MLSVRLQETLGSSLGKQLGGTVPPLEIFLYTGVAGAIIYAFLCFLFLCPCGELLVIP